MLRISHLKIISLISLFTIAILILFFDNFREQNLQINCRTSQYREDLVNGQEFLTTIVMILSPEGKGEINFLGSLKHGQQNEYLVSRTVYFNYSLHNGNELLMSSMRVVRTIEDTTPDALFNRNVIDLSTKVHRLFVKKIYNAYMVSTPYSATGICVE